MTAGLDDLLARLRAVLLSGPPLRLAMLFGSMARGDAGPASDVDIAVLPTDPDLALGAELDLGAALERACGRPVDLVRLDQASTLLRWRIAREGVVLFAEPLVERVRFLASAASEHGDFAPAYSAASELFRRRLAARAGAKEGS